jgi:hypothetical protein
VGQIYWYGLRSGRIFTLLTIFVVEGTPPDLFSPCKKLHHVGIAIRSSYRGARVQEVLSSITSKHLSTISLEIAHPDWRLLGTPERSHQWWGYLENVLCQLADRCSVNNKLALDIFWWRRRRHRGDCGVTYPDMIMPRFREKGSIHFTESGRLNL